jgi:hypothetical protein
MTQPTGSAAIAGWVSAYKEQENDELSFSQALDGLNGLPTDEKFLLMMTLIMPDSMLQLGDKVNIKSQELNIASALGRVVTNITNDLNGISPTNTIPAGTAGSNQSLATDLITQCSALSALLGPSSTSQTWTNPDTGQQETKSWISSSTLSTATNALSSFTGLIGTSGGAAGVVSNVLNWINNPTSGKPSGQVNIQSLNSDLSTVSNAFSGLSQMAQNAVQFETTLVTQSTNCARTLLQDLVNFEKGVQQNLGPK